VYLLQWVQKRLPRWRAGAPARASWRLGRQFQSGVNVANIDNLGNVHPDTMWWHHDLGNVRERPFSADLDADTSDPLMAGLKAKPRPVGGRCGACALRHLRRQHPRARPAAHRRPLGRRPGLLPDDDEIGLAGRRRAATTRAAKPPHQARHAEAAA
jgi:MoaA/NifB/PqqE/SkfB family radical SAM enzyme